MTKEKQKEFAMRVSQANRTELVAITYDIIIENIKCAGESLKSNDIDSFRAELKSAGRFLAELMHSLDYNYPISVNLLKIYEYIQRVLISSGFAGKDKGFLRRMIRQRLWKTHSRS